MRKFFVPATIISSVVGMALFSPAAVFAATPNVDSGTDQVSLASGVINTSDGLRAADSYVSATLLGRFTENDPPVVNAELPSILLGQAETSSSGQYRLTVDVNSVLQDTSREGAALARAQEDLIAGRPVDVIFQAFSGRSEGATQMATVTYDSAARTFQIADNDVSSNATPEPAVENFSRSSARPEVQPSVERTGDANIEIVEGEATVDFTLSAPGSAANADSAQRATAAAPTNPCYTVTGTTPQVPVQLGTLQATASGGFSAQFTFSNGASAELGGGASFEKLAGWRWNYSYATSTSTSTTFPALTTAASRNYVSDFSYYSFEGRGCWSGTVPPDYSYYFKPYAHWGGARVTSGGTLTATDCASYVNGSSVTIDSGQGMFWSNSVKSTPFIGVDMGVKSGYSSGVKYAISMTSNRSICGTDGPIGSGTVGAIVIK